MCVFHHNGNDCLAAIKMEISNGTTSYKKIAEHVEGLKIEENIYSGLSKEEADAVLNELVRAYFIVGMIGVHGLNHIVMPYILRRYEVKV